MPQRQWLVRICVTFGDDMSEGNRVSFPQIVQVKPFQEVETQITVTEYADVIGKSLFKWLGLLGSL